jgi:hypothetical protein
LCGLDLQRQPSLRLRFNEYATGNAVPGLGTALNCPAGSAVGCLSTGRFQTAVRSFHSRCTEERSCARRCVNVLQRGTQGDAVDPGSWRRESRIPSRRCHGSNLGFLRMLPVESRHEPRRGSRSIFQAGNRRKVDGTAQEAVRFTAALQHFLLGDPWLPGHKTSRELRLPR